MLNWPEKISPSLRKRLRSTGAQMFDVIVQLESLKLTAEEAGGLSSKEDLLSSAKNEMGRFVAQLEILKKRGEKIEYKPYEILSSVFVKAYRDVIMKIAELEGVLEIIDNQAVINDSPSTSPECAWLAR
jgi:hypothetical protein